MILDIVTDSLLFQRWESVVALLILVAGGIILKFINDKTKATDDKVNQVLSTLTTTNGGSHIKDQLNDIQRDLKDITVKVVETDTIIKENKETFKKMRDQFRDDGYFQTAEKRHDSHEARLNKLESRLKKRESKPRWFRR